MYKRRYVHIRYTYVHIRYVCVCVCVTCLGPLCVSLLVAVHFAEAAVGAALEVHDAPLEEAPGPVQLVPLPRNQSINRFSSIYRLINPSINQSSYP